MTDALEAGIGRAAALPALALVAGLLWPLAPLDRQLAAELAAEQRSSCWCSRCPEGPAAALW